MIPPKIPGVRFLGVQTLAHYAPQAALLLRPLARDVIDAVYKYLPRGARQNMLLSRRWNLYGVLATEEWAQEHARLNRPPSEKEAA